MKRTAAATYCPSQSCTLCANADWDPLTEWGRCVDRRGGNLPPPESGIYLIHRRMYDTECSSFAPFTPATPE
jgi:hypothetical protein